MSKTLYSAKKKRTLRNITVFASFLIAIVVYIFGAFVLANVIHETSHKIDFQNVSNGNDYMCVLTYPNEWDDAVAYYKTGINLEKGNEVELLEKYTEKKAYFVETLLNFILFGSFIILVAHFRNSFGKN